MRACYMQLCMVAVMYGCCSCRSVLALCLQEHVRQLGRLLLRIGDPSASNMQDAVGAMQALAVAAFKLILCLLQNPVANQALVASRLDDGSPAVNSLDDEFYISLLVRALQEVPEACR